MSKITDLFQALPREARDTLFVLAVLGWTIAPHANNLPLWCPGLAFLLILWRAYLAVSNGPQPGRWTMVCILLFAAILNLWSFSTVLGRQAGISMLVVLIALKTLELRARRDSFVIFFLGFFLVLTHFLFSQSIAVALAMVVSVWGLLTALVLTHMPVGQPALTQAARIAAKTALLGTPIMLALFVFFPRVAPLWGVPQDSIASSGLSRQLHMGSIAELAMSDEIVMRIRFPKQVPPAEKMYFRGPVLSEISGAEWTPAAGSDTQPSPRADLIFESPAIPYEITLEPQRSLDVPLLEAAMSPPIQDGAAERPIEMQRSAELSWEAKSPINERLRLNAEAYMSFRIGPFDPEPGLTRYLRLPNGHSPRTRAWATELKNSPDMAQADTQGLVNAVLRHVGDEKFFYTLTPGLYGEKDPKAAIDEFWLDRRQGFCEHFATTFVVIMRAMGVPARVVLGYQGADPQPVDGYYIVRRNSAHAWAEYWQAGRGWVRVDPTAAVSPDRIKRSSRLPPPRGLIAGTLRQALGGANGLAQLQRSWEAVNNRWNQWVLNYSQRQQNDLLKQMGFSSPDWTDLGLMLFFCCLGAGLIGFGVYRWQMQPIDPWVRQMDLLRRQLREVGLQAADHDPPLAMAQGVNRMFGDAGTALADALRELDALRYGSSVKPRQLAIQFSQIRMQAQALGKR